MKKLFTSMCLLFVFISAEGAPQNLTRDISEVINRIFNLTVRIEVCGKQVDQINASPNPLESAQILIDTNQLQYGVSGEEAIALFNDFHDLAEIIETDSNISDDVHHLAEAMYESFTYLDQLIMNGGAQQDSLPEDVLELFKQHWSEK